MNLFTTEQEFELSKIVLDKGILAIILAFVMYKINKRLEDFKIEQNKLNEIEREKRDEEAKLICRYYIPKIEYSLDANFYGPQEDWCIMQLQLLAHNKGNTQRKMKSIAINVRGIKYNEPLSFWNERGGKRLEFPHLLIKDNLLPQNGNYFYYVEPSVKQTFNYITKVPKEISYVRVHIEVQTINEAPGDDKSENTFTEERLFKIK